MPSESNTSFWGRAKSFLPSRSTTFKLLAGSAFLMSVVQAYSEMSDAEKEELRAQLGDSFKLCTDTIASHITYCIVKGVHPGAALLNPDANAAYDCSLSMDEIFDQHGLTDPAARAACKTAVTPTDEIQYRVRVGSQPGF